MFEIIGLSLWEALYDLRYTIFILYFAYLIFGYLTHHKSKGYANLFKKSRKTGPLIGALLGCVPQCGFSSVMADVYSKKAITLGTLIAVFISTSDEAIPVLLGHPEFYLDMVVLIAFKVGFAILFGYLVDLVYSWILKKTRKSEQRVEPEVIEKTGEEHSHCDCECHKHGDEEKHAHHEHSGNCCADNIFLDALFHTINIAIFIFLASAVINILKAYVGLDFITAWLGDNAYLQILLCALIGFIPNCAGSVFLVQSYIEGGILFSSMLAGLSVGSGIGIFVLWTKNKGKKGVKENIIISSLLYVFGVLSGIFVNFLY